MMSAVTRQFGKMKLCGLIAVMLLLLGFAASVRDDPLHEARCAVLCSDNATCFNKCLNAKMTKPGVCPDASSLSPFDLACLKACSSDSDCTNTDKCCSHSCGVTCQRPDDLQSVPGLPEIPANVTVRELRRIKTVSIEWSSSGKYYNEQYVLEGRHHIGQHFSASRLGPWHFLHRSAKPRFILKKLVIGRWYIFRVAAINENGTKGYSTPSDPYTLPIGPKPPEMINNVTGTEFLGRDNTIWGLITWETPASDLPIQRYKVFWSRRLQDNPPYVLVNQASVPGNTNKFVVKHLEPNSLYFVQVQAFTQFGRYKFKSEKGGGFINTTEIHSMKKSWT